MAFLAPLAGAAGTAATAGAATTALGAGLSAGTILGTGAASSGILGGLGLNALGGMASTLPASASLMAAAPTALGAGASALAPAAGIFAKAAPALGGLSSLAPAATQAAPGLLTTMGMSPLAGLAGSTSMVPTATGLTSLYSTVPAITTSPAAGGLLNTLGMSPLGGAQAIIPNATVAGQTAALETLKGNVIGAGAQAQTNLAQQLAMDAAKKQAVGSGTQSLVNTATANANLANTNANIVDAINRNVAGGAAQASPGIASGPAPYTPASPIIKGQNFLQNAGNFLQNPSMDAAMDYAKEHPMATAAGAYGAYKMLKPDEKKPSEKSPGLIRPYEFTRTELPDTREPGGSSERLYFTETFTPLEPYEAPGPEYKKAAEGGLMSYAIGGPVEMMAAQNAVGANTGYPMAGINTAMYSNPMVQRPEAVNVISPSGDAGVSAYSGEPKFAAGGLSDLGGYSDGGRLLKGPGDGVSDSIPAVIGNRQPARLADGEFVVPARIVSELGNGSTEAGARKLYAMMDRVQKARSKTVGKKKVAVNTRADKHLPA